MPWCKDCGLREASKKLNRPEGHLIAGLDWKPKRIGFIQYLRCKLKLHNCQLIQTTSERMRWEEMERHYGELRRRSREAEP